MAHEFSYEALPIIEGKFISGLDCAVSKEAEVRNSGVMRFDEYILCEKIWSAEKGSFG